MDKKENLAACGRTCKGCWWYVEFPWYVKSHEGYCNHPLAKTDPNMRLYTAGEACGCIQYLDRSVLGGEGWETHR